MVKEKRNIRGTIRRLQKTMKKLREKHLKSLNSTDMKSLKNPLKNTKRLWRPQLKKKTNFNGGIKNKALSGNKALDLPAIIRQLMRKTHRKKILGDLRLMKPEKAR